MKNSRSRNHSYQLLSISEVAWLLGVNDGRVWRAIRLGTLPVVARRGRLLVPAWALANLADDGEPCTGPVGRGGGR
jgi:predicted DNA-binding transcriptional regulator AlpA